MEINLKRNLIYFICPFKSNIEWILNVDMLLKYIDIFNNKKIVVISTGEGMISPDIVKQRFRNRDIKFILMDNDGRVGEGFAFFRMLKEIKSLDPLEITFYAHSKGVSPSHEHPNPKLKNIRVWRNIMYHYCLRDIKSIEHILSDFSCCGCFINKILHQEIENKTKWFYDGSFFWFNNKEVFKKKYWDTFHHNRFMTEIFLGKIIKWNKAYCLTNYDKGWIYDYSIEDWEAVLPDFLKHVDFEDGLDVEGK